VRKKNVKRCKTLSFIGIVGDEGIDDEGGWLEGSKTPVKSFCQLHSGSMLTYANAGIMHIGYQVFK